MTWLEKQQTIIQEDDNFLERNLISTLTIEKTAQHLEADRRCSGSTATATKQKKPL